MKSKHAFKTQQGKTAVIGLGHTLVNLGEKITAMI